MKKLFMLLALALTQALAMAHANPLEEELLEAPKAFALTLKASSADTIEAQWKIARGYYLYRDKFKFEVLDDNVQLLPPVLPAGIRKKDEFFGEVETYRKTIKIKLPFTRTRPEAATTLLRITSQGCADVGVCYPPLIQEVSLKLPAGKGGAPIAAVESIKDKGIRSLGDPVNQIETDSGGGDDFLSVDQAFTIDVEARDGKTLVARLKIAPGYYLYKDKTHFQLSRADNTQLASYDLPTGQTKIDPYIGETEIYPNSVEIKLPLERNSQQRSAFTLTAGYQGCAEQGICYPPTSKNIDIVLPQGEIQGVVFTPADDPVLGNAAADASGGGSDIGAFLAAVAGAFGVGLLLTFTPCVLPMIPILSSIIVGQSNVAANAKLTKLKGGILSLSYVLGTAVTYTAAGILAGATGDQLQAYFQNPYAIGAVSAIFVLLSLSMFGFYELQMPAFIQSHMTKKSQNIRGGTLLGTFVLGILSSLIVGACVSPLIIGVLGVAIQKADPVLGGALMFSMAMGMGMILIAIGIGAGFLLPKAGAWMDRVKHVFGVLLLAVAIYLLSALPQVPVLLLWAALLIVSAVYLGATQSLPHNASNWHYLWKGIGTVLLLWGVLALLGGLAGERDIFNPLPRATIVTGDAAPVATSTPTINTELFERYTSLAQIETALAAARTAGKPAILDFYATWCKDCVRMEKITLADAKVRAILQDYALIQADVTETNAETNAIKQRYQVLGPPAMLFFASNGEEKTALRFYGYRTVAEFLALLEKI